MSLFRPTYTRPVPPDAKTVMKDGKPHVRVAKRGGKTELHRLTKNGKNYVCEVETWYARFTRPDGTEDRIPLSPNRKAAEIMYADLLRNNEMGRAGALNPFAAHAAAPLAQHVEAWSVDLRSRESGEKHVRESSRAVLRVCAACEFELTGDLKMEPAQEHLAAMLCSTVELPDVPDGQEWFTRDEVAALTGNTKYAVTPMMRRYDLKAKGNGRARRYHRDTVLFLRSKKQEPPGPRTLNLVMMALKAFGAFMVRSKRMAENPFVGLTEFNEDSDKRHLRRPLLGDELERLILAAESSARTFRGLTGLDRATLYAATAATGFRSDEMASLRIGSFNLAGNPPTVTIGGKHTKNGKTVVQPLPTFVVPRLENYFANRSTTEAVWEGTWHERSSEMVQLDLRAAGIPFVLDMPEGPRFADFHSIRHTYIYRLDKSGATIKEAMKLARHSDPKLTLKVYGQADLAELGGVVDNLGRNLVGSGADGRARAGTKVDGRTVGERKMEDGGKVGETGETQGNEGDIQSSSGRIRTYDPPVNSRLLGGCLDLDSKSTPATLPFSCAPACSADDPRRARVLAAFDAAHARGDSAACDAIHAAAVATLVKARAA